MNNQDIHIGIVGAGRIGTAIYELLVSSSSDYKISIADEAEKKGFDNDFVFFKKLINFLVKIFRS